MKLGQLGILLGLLGLVQAPFQALAVARESRQKGAAPETKPCGTSADLANQVEVCAQPLMEIIEGTMDQWPKNDQDVEKVCNDFAVSEKCVRERGRKCGKGLEKVITSTLANSVQRTRKRECVKTKLPSLLKLTKCVEAHREIPFAIISNATARMNVIENMKDLDRKTNAICCTINDIEAEMVRLLKPICPVETAMVVRMYRSVLQDVREIICPAPKCSPDPFRGYSIPRLNVTRTEGIVSYMMRIVFSLGN